MDELLQAFASGLCLRGERAETASEEAKEAFKEAVVRYLDSKKSEVGCQIRFDHYLSKIRNRKPHMEPVMVESSNRELLELLAELPTPPEGTFYTFPDKTFLIFQVQYVEDGENMVVPIVVCPWIQHQMSVQ